MLHLRVRGKIYDKSVQFVLNQSFNYTTAKQRKTNEMSINRKPHNVCRDCY